MPKLLVPIQRKPGLIVNGPLVNRKRLTRLKCVQDIEVMLDKRIPSLIKKYHNFENYKQKNGKNYLKYMNKATTLISPLLYPRLKIWLNNLKNIKMTPIPI
jgi:GTP:adenosylcobinamide-phosphate guanylyltransferase